MTKLLMMLALLASVAVAQPEETGVIRVSSNLVAVPVLVTDSAGKPVLNLSETDFRLEKDGQPQRIVRLGEPGSAPVDLALLLDVSGSTYEKFRFEQQAASEFVRQVLRPVDSITVFSLGKEPKLIQSRTGNSAAAIAAVMGLSPTKDATAFYDAVANAASYLARTANPGSRRVLVVISDGEDNNSAHSSFEDALQALQRQDCLFYSINPGGPSIELNVISMKAQQQMAALASAIGGAFIAGTREELPVVFRKIADELQAQYMLGFYFQDEKPDGRFRRIAVRLPQRPELHVRARQGYYAPKNLFVEGRSEP